MNEKLDGLMVEFIRQHDIQKLLIINYKTGNFTMMNNCLAEIIHGSGSVYTILEGINLELNKETEPTIENYHFIDENMNFVTTNLEIGDIEEALLYTSTPEKADTMALKLSNLTGFQIEKYLIK